MAHEESTQKELIAGVFARAASSYDRIGPSFFAHFGRRLVELAQLSKGTRVLDVATGTGQVLFPAAEQVGSKGSVIGIDIAAPMVEAAVAEISWRGLKNAEARQMDAESLDFADAVFDAVLCGFSLFFFPSLDRALSEFHRVLRPGGRLAVSTFAEQDPASKGFAELLKAHGYESKLMLHALRTPEAVEAALRKGVFENVRVTFEEADFVYADEEEWWAMNWSLALRAPLEQMSAETLRRFKADAFSMMRAFKQPDGLHHPRRVLCAIATAPA
jgi:O-methyltransferase/aklanonic acid methyltransferase